MAPRKTRSISPASSEPEGRVSPVPPKLEEARVGVHARLTLAADGKAEVERVAYCPAREHTVGLSVCETCPKFVELVDAHDGQSVRCVPEIGTRRIKRELILPQLDLQDVALRVPVGEVMTRLVVCVNPDTCVDAVRAILVETELPCVPVVSNDGLLVGIVTHQTLLAAGAGLRAGELMAAAVLSVAESAPLAHAMATMAQAGIMVVPVVADDGSVVGAVSALEALRFIVRRWGYETPSA